MYFTRLTPNSFPLWVKKQFRFAFFFFFFLFPSMKSGGNHCILFVILSVLIFASEDWKVIAGP